MSSFVSRWLCASAPEPDSPEPSPRALRNAYVRFFGVAGTWHEAVPTGSVPAQVAPALRRPTAGAQHLWAVPRATGAAWAGNVTGMRCPGGRNLSRHVSRAPCQADAARSKVLEALEVEINAGFARVPTSAGPRVEDGPTFLALSEEGLPPAVLMLARDLMNKVSNLSHTLETTQQEQLEVLETLQALELAHRRSEFGRARAEALATARCMPVLGGGGGTACAGGGGLDGPGCMDGRLMGGRGCMFGGFMGGRGMHPWG